MTGSVFSIQATYPKEQVTIEGKWTAWKLPIEGAPPVTYRNCSRSGSRPTSAPVCASTVYYVLADTPENIGVKIGSFEEYRFPWALNVSALPMPGGHHS